MIPLDDIRDQLCDLFKNQFPDAEFSISERRSAILEIRIFFAPEVFMEPYFNAITGKKSFTLVEIGVMTIIDIGITIQLKIPKVIYHAMSHL